VDARSINRAKNNPTTPSPSGSIQCPAGEPDEQAGTYFAVFANPESDRTHLANLELKNIDKHDLETTVSFSLREAPSLAA